MTHPLEKEICKAYLENIPLKDIKNSFKIAHTQLYRIIGRNKCTLRGKARKRLIRDDIFDCIKTEKAAYILGFLYADGYLNRERFSILLTLQKRDESILHEIAKEIYVTDYHLTKDRANLRLSIYGKNIYSQMEKLGLFQKKSETLGFPTNEQVPKELMRHFIRGAFDGDGCFGQAITRKALQGSFSIIGSKNFIFGLKCFLEENMKETLCVVQDKRHPTCWIISGASFDKIKKFYSFLYEDASIFLERKRHKIRDYIQNKENEHAQRIFKRLSTKGK